MSAPGAIPSQPLESRVTGGAATPSVEWGAWMLYMLGELYPKWPVSQRHLWVELVPSAEGFYLILKWSSTCECPEITRRLSREGAVSTASVHSEGIERQLGRKAVPES